MAGGKWPIQVVFGRLRHADGRPELSSTDLLGKQAVATHGYANAEYLQQTYLSEVPTLVSLLQRPPLAMFDPP